VHLPVLLRQQAIQSSWKFAAVDKWGCDFWQARWWPKKWAETSCLRNI